MVCECIDFLFDENLFEEFDMYVEYCCIDFGMEKNKIFGDGVVIGWGIVNGCVIYVFVKDFMVFGGFFFEEYVKKIMKI